MKILNIVKYYDPCQGGMEAVVKNIVEGIVANTPEADFTVYSNNHIRSFKKETTQKKQIAVIKEVTPIYLKSQPLNLRYPSLKNLILENEVVHHHYPFPTMEAMLLKNIKKLSNKKFVITWHANIKNSRWSWIEKFYNPMIFKLLDRADAIVVTSPQLFEASTILKKYKEKVTVIPLSFDPKYSVSEPKKFPEDKFQLLFVGKFRKYKGVDFLLKAIQNLDVNLTVVGNGEELQNLQNLVEELGIKAKVNFKTEVNDDELQKIYKASDLFILPSINEAEAFGVVQLEAMANGLPVINTNLESGVPFVSLSGETGETVSPRDADQLADAIQKIITDSSLYESYSVNSLKRVKLFTREKMAESYLNLYKTK